MKVALRVGGQSWTWVDPEKCRAAIEGLRANAARYEAKAAAFRRDADLVQAALDIELEKEEAKKAAKKAAKVGTQQGS